MFRTTAAALCLSIAPAGAIACDFHDGFGGAYLAYGYGGFDAEAAREAPQPADRETAMAATRTAFLQRFDVEVDDRSQQDSGSEETSAADPSAPESDWDDLTR